MKKNVLVISILIFTAMLYGAINLTHTPIPKFKVGETVSIKLFVSDGFDEIKEVNLYYRETGEQTYKFLKMDKGSSSNPEFELLLTDTHEYKAGLEYYFQIIKKSGMEETLRKIQPEINPYSVQAEISESTSDIFALLSPDPNFPITGENFVIAISTFALDQQIDELQFYFNGKDVTSRIEKYSNMLVYKVSNAKHAMHNFYIKARLNNGAMVESVHWNTKVTKKLFELPMNMEGRAIFTSDVMSKSAENDDYDDDDKKADLLLLLNGDKNWFRFKSKLFLSSLETHKEQSVNRYSIKMNVPYFGLSLGDYSPNYGAYTLRSTNIRGVHTKLDFKNFRLLVSSGTNKRKINGESYLDSLGTTQIDAGTFKRNTLSTRMEVGNKRGFIWGFSFVKNRDKLDSLDEIYYLADPDSEDTDVMVKPVDNLVVGTDANLALFKQKVKFGAEVAMSYYNTNIIDGPMSADSINAEFDTDLDLPIDPADLEDIFIINKNIEPFKPGVANLAYKTYIRAYFLKNLLNISYSAVGSSFNSIATSSVQKDQQTISINDNLQLLDNKLSLTVLMNIISDNVYDTKEMTTTTAKYMTQMFYRPNSRAFFNLSYSNSGTKDDASDETNSTEIKNYNFVLGGGYNLEAIRSAPTKLSLNFSNSANVDEKNNSFDYTTNYLIMSAKSDFTYLPLRTTMSYSLSLNENQVDEYSSNYHSLFMKGEFNFLEDKLRPYLDFRYTSYGGDIDKQSKQLLNLGSKYNIFSQTSISTNVGIVAYQNNDVEDSDYSQLNWELRISQRF